MAAETGRDLSSEKAALRAAARQARESIAPGEREAAENAICAAVRKLFAGRRLQAVLGYRSVRHEANIDPVLEDLLAAGVHVYLPRVSGPGDLELVEVRSLQADCRAGRFGVPEPLGLAAAALPEIDCVLVPGLAFDRSGGRVGFGGGYYDRLLAHLPPTVLRAGIAFEAQMIPAVPMAPWDQRVHLVVTENGAFDKASNQTAGDTAPC